MKNLNELIVESARQSDPASVDPVYLPDRTGPPDVPWFEAFAAGWILNNPLSGFIDRGGFSPDFEFDPDYDPTTDPNLKGEDIRLYSRTLSAEHSDWLKGEIRRNAVYQQTANNRGGGWGAFAGNIGNPLITFPAIATGGASLPTMLAADISAEFVNEMILHGQQPLRTKAETITNLAMVAAIDATVWKVGRGVEKTAENRALRREVNELLAAVNKEIDGFEYVGMSASGKPKYRPVTKMDDSADDITSPAISEAGEDVVEGHVPGMSFSPVGDTFKNSFSQRMKQLIQRLVENPFRLEKVESGEAAFVAAETIVRRAQGDVAKIVEFGQQQFKAYQKVGGGGLAEEDFMHHVMRVMDTGKSSGNEYIDAVAKYYRKLDDEFFDTELQLGVRTERKLRAGHIQRIWSRSKIGNDRAGLKQTIKNHLKMRKAQPGSTSVIVRYSDDMSYDLVARDQVATIKADDPKLEVIDLRRLEDDIEFDRIAQSMIDNIDQAGKMVDDVDPDLLVYKPGSAHERSLHWIPTRDLEPWLETNAASVMAIRARQSRRAEAFQKIFPEDPSLLNARQEIVDEYDQLIAEANAAGDVKLANKMNDRRRKDLIIMNAMIDRLQGRFGLHDDPSSTLVRTGRWLRLGTLMGFGANIASTSLTDFISPILRHGLEPYREGLKLLNNKAARKEYFKYARHLGIAVQSVTSSKAAMIMNLNQMSKTEQRAMNMYGKFTGLNLVTDVAQAMNVSSVSMTYKKWFDNWANVGDAKKARIRDMGISEEMVERIRRQWDMFGERYDGVTIPMTSHWPDRQAADALDYALIKEGHIGTPLPGLGDKPLWLSTEAGKFIGMFQSFVSGAHNRLLISGFQRRDADFMSGVLFLSAAGMVVHSAKQMAAGRDISDKDPIELAISGMDRTGIFGWWSVPIKMASQVAAGRPAEFVWRAGAEGFFAPPGMEYLNVFGPLGIDLATGTAPDADTIWRAAKAAPMLNSYHLLDIAQQQWENHRLRGEW